MLIRLEVEASVRREYDGNWRGEAIVTIYQDDMVTWVVPHGCEHARMTLEHATADAEELAASLRR